MAHIFDIMTTVCRQIDDFAAHRNSGGPNVPDFLAVMANRAIDNIPGIRIDESKPISMKQCIRSHAGDPITLVYTTVAENITEPIIDTFAIINSGKDRKGKDIDVCDTAIGVILPALMFNESTDIKETVQLLRKVYFGILDTDNMMHYSANPAMIRLANSNKIRIPTYDIEMTICAICCMYISLNCWFISDESSLIITSVIDAFTDKEISAKGKEKITTIIERCCMSTRSLKDSIGTGKILKLFFM